LILIAAGPERDPEAHLLESWEARELSLSGSARGRQDRGIYALEDPNVTLEDPSEMQLRLRIHRQDPNSALRWRIRRQDPNPALRWRVR
jgi:hypothetical protein